MGLFSNLFGKRNEGKGVDGYLVWKFGMSKEEVKALGFGPYSDVPPTGGCETHNGSFLGKPTRISFIFNSQGLSRIQIWAYVGNDKAEATKAFVDVFGYMKGVGELGSTGLRLEQFKTPQDLEATLLKMFEIPSDGQTRKVQIKVKDVQPENVNIFTSLMDHPEEGYMVFLYYDKK